MSKHSVASKGIMYVIRFVKVGCHLHVITWTTQLNDLTSLVFSNKETCVVYQE